MSTAGLGVPGGWAAFTGDIQPQANRKHTSDKVVFDQGHSEDSNPARRMGLAHVGAAFGAFHRTDRDRRPVRQVVTARLLGDPSPDRVVPVLPPESRQGHREPDPAPVYLTFREYETALADGTYGMRP